MTIVGRQSGWLNPRFHRDFRELLHRSALRHGVTVPAYCLMPDHMHLMVAGMVTTADQLLWARAFRRALNLRLTPFRLQKQAYDHILRPDESSRDGFASLIHYLGENPVRAGLVAHSLSWIYQGACIPAEPDIDPRRLDFHERWWALWNSEGP
jgi:putative transposase